MKKPEDIKKREEIYTAVGHALSVWSMIEENLCLIFTRVTISDPLAPIGAAMAAFWAIESFRGKLNAIDAALRLNFSRTRIVNEWDRVQKRAREKNRLRNELAHGTVLMFGDKIEDIYFAPSFFKTRLVELAAFDPASRTIPDLRPKNRLTARQIDDRTRAFRQFQRRLDHFHSRVYDEVKKRQAASEKSRGEHRTAKD